MKRKTVPGAVGGTMSTYSASLLYLLGRATRETRPSVSFPPPSIPSPSFCESRSEARSVLGERNSIMVAKGTSSNDFWSSASVTRKAPRTLASARREARTSGVTSWRKIISGDFGPSSSRIWLRMSLARETGREEKASMFQVIRDSVFDFDFDCVCVCVCVYVTSLCAFLFPFLEGMGVHVRVEELKMESARQSLLVTAAMAVCWNGSFWRGLSTVGGLLRSPMFQSPIKSSEFASVSHTDLADGSPLPPSLLSFRTLLLCEYGICICLPG